MVTPSNIEIMLPGPVDVESFMSNLPMYSAHRGGSADWPQHSLRAYTQSVYRGYPCLEVSIQRTLDGVLVCNHDPSINGIVYGGVSGLPDISAMTWADITNYQIRPPDRHLERGPEPFLRLVDLLDVYGESHIFMIDPKNISSTHYSSILDLLDSRGGPDRFLGKWVGSNLTWSNALKARSYDSWGAFFSSDWTPGSGFNSSWADQWTMLGLNYDASQAHWDEILATGKKIIGHICPDEASVEMARSKGAVGFQVSGIDLVDPRPVRVSSPIEIDYDGLPSGTMVNVVYDEIGEVWPSRPTSRADIVVVWIGPDSDPSGMLLTDLHMVTGPAPDSVAPSVPTGLNAVDIQSNSITVGWSASTDNIGVTGYEVRVDGGVPIVKTASQLTHNIGSLDSETEYSIDVRAFDAAGNYSAYSTALVVSTTMAGTYSSFFGTDTSPSSLLTSHNDLSAGGETGIAVYPVGAGRRIRIYGIRYLEAATPLGGASADLTARAYLRQYNSGGISLPGPIASEPADEEKIHTADRVGGSWTEIMFDTPVEVVTPVEGVGSDQEIAILTIQVGTGQNYQTAASSSVPPMNSGGTSAKVAPDGKLALSENSTFSGSIGMTKFPFRLNAGVGLSDGTYTNWYGLDLLYTEVV